MVEGNKTLLYAISGAALIIGGALIYHYLTDPENATAGDSGVDLNKMLEEIDALGPVARGPNGMLSFNYYKELFIIVNKYTKLKNAPQKK